MSARQTPEAPRCSCRRDLIDLCLAFALGLSVIGAWCYALPLVVDWMVAR